MKIKLNQLKNNISKQGLAAIYLLTGDEPLQMKECADILRTAARQQGFVERVVLTVETGFTWNSLDNEANSLSLFANKRLLEIRLGNKSPGNEGTKILKAYTDNLPADTILIIIADKLDASKQKTKWFTCLDKNGIIIQIWPIEGSQLPSWISQRMNHYGLQASAEVINMIAERSEGHLLACSQEIEKLHLLYGSGHITAEQILDAIVDNARFEVFSWIDTVLQGNTQRSIRQLQSMRSGGVEPILVAWALDREIRNLSHMTYELQKGQRQEQIFKAYRIWQNRKMTISNAIKRHPHPRIWQNFLKRTLQIERIIKGVNTGNVWDELQKLSLQVSLPTVKHKNSILTVF
ncbi:DNA polymerase III subunit delta [Candidatus Halobeggiatoa sp. HSG11]|nr:DNA polymerase III subunit delta [Candidatus Halobeggiatoa sp. HSG11]